MTAKGSRAPSDGDGKELSSGSDFERRIYSPHTIATIVAELAEQGVDADAALDDTQLTATQLDDHTTKVSYKQIDSVIRNALRLSNNPTVALRAGQRLRITATGMYGYALLSSPTQLEARAFAAKYIRVTGALCDFSVESNENVVTINFQPMYWPGSNEYMHRFAVEFALSAHQVATGDWVGPHFAFLRVFLDYEAPPHAEAYESLFRCPVVFGQKCCGYEFKRDDARSELADLRSYAMAPETCEQLLEEVNRAGGMAADIRRILIEDPGRYPSLEAIAAKLNAHPRAVRRKLESESTSYRELLAEVRTRLATEYLRKTAMTNEEIASRLGYSDAANFRHAFIRWTGSSPSEFRNATRAD